MRINITAGDCLNDILKENDENWIPFREAMERGTYTSPLFSTGFCRERSSTLGVLEEEYVEKLSGFSGASRTL